MAIYDPASPVQNPRSLLRLLHVAAVVSSLLILSLSGVATYYLYTQYVVSSAEAEAVAISESIVALESHLLLRSTGEGGSRLIVDESELPELDGTLKRFLMPYDILKIKVFSPKGLVVYSTDRAIIGQKNLRNERLAVALSGRSVSQLQTKEEVFDLKDEKRFDVDVVETYVPIRNEHNEIVGSLEIYQDITRYREEIVAGVVASLLLLAAILASVFTMEYLILRMAVTQLCRVQEELHQLATVDGLTDLLNRREIMRMGENEFSRHVRQQGTANAPPFSLIMADLDEFKLINDKYGHPEGDEALRVVAQRISGQMRRYSIVGRYGGEEFLVILPEADEEEVHAVAERIRHAVSTRPVVLNGDKVRVTLSLGITTVLPDDRTFDEALIRADRGLYQAKAEGRNRVVMAC